MLSSHFQGGVATLLTDNATETGNTGWLWPSCRQPIHPHLWRYPLCLLAHHRSWWGVPKLLVWAKSIPVHHYTYSGVGEEFSPNSLIATIEVLFLDRPLCCLQPQLQLCA